MARTVDIIVRAIGAAQAAQDIKGVGEAGKKTGSDLKAAAAGSAAAWSPYIGQLKAAEAEQKRLAEEARRTANVQRDAATRASAAITAASRDQRQAAKEAAAEARIAAKQAEDAAKRQAQAYRDAAKAATDAQRVQAAANRQAQAQSAMGTTAVAPQAQPVSRRGAVLAATGAALAGGTYAVNAASNTIFQKGSDAAEAENLIKESFEGSNDAITAWGDNLQKTLGVSSVETRKNAATFNLMFDSMGLATGKSLELSKGLAELGNDMASFYNLKPEEAFEKLRAGITGESEPLKSLGIIISEETTKQYAYANGIAKTGEELTEQQKVLARYGQIMAATAKAQGDLARTMDSPANSARRLAVAWETMQTKAGEGAATVRNVWMNALIPVIDKMNEGGGAAIKFGGGLVEGVKMVASVGSPLWGVAQGIIEIRNAMNLATIAKNGSTVAAGKNTLALSLETGAVTANGNAAAVAAGKWGLLGRAKALTSAGAIGGAGAAWGTVGAVGGVALGAAGGYGAYDDYATLGDDNAALKGIATTVGLAAAAMFVPGGAVAVALATGFRYVFNELVNRPMERAAEGAISDEDQGKLFTSSASQKAEYYEKRARELEEEGDSTQAASFRIEAARWKRQAARGGKPSTATSAKDPATAAAVAASPAAAMSAAGTTGGLTFSGGQIKWKGKVVSGASPLGPVSESDVTAAEGAVESAEDDYKAISRQYRDADKETKKTMRATVDAARDRLDAAREKLATIKRLAGIAKKDAATKKREADEAADRAAELAATDIATKYELQIAGLEKQVEAAQKAGNEAAEKRLRAQIANLVTEGNYQSTLAQIAGMDKTDPAAIAFEKQKAEKLYNREKALNAIKFSDIPAVVSAFKGFGSTGSSMASSAGGGPLRHAPWKPTAAFDDETGLWKMAGVGTQGAFSSIIGGGFTMPTPGRFANGIPGITREDRIAQANRQPIDVNAPINTEVSQGMGGDIVVRLNSSGEFVIPNLIGRALRGRPGGQF